MAEVQLTIQGFGAPCVSCGSHNTTVRTENAPFQYGDGENATYLDANKLTEWKHQNSVFTHKADYDMPEPWAAWANDPNPLERLSCCCGDNCFGFGNTEKEAILKLCHIEHIPAPFWW